jgi:hypothetical protein
MRERGALLVAALLVLPAAGCLSSGGGSVDYAVDNSVQRQTQNGDTQTSWDARLDATFEGYDGTDDHTLDVPESGVRLEVDPALEEDSVQVTVTGPDGEIRFDQTVGPDGSSHASSESSAEGTWTVQVDADGATGDLVVELS